MQGEDSLAFGCDADDGAYVVRINDSAAGLEKDRLAFERFSRPGLPIPEVTKITAIGDGSHLCVSRRLPGETLQALSGEEAFAYGRTVEGVLAALAEIAPGAISGFGPFDGTGAGGFSSWEAFILDAPEWDWEDLLPVDQYRQVRRVMTAIAKMAVNLPHERSIVHGDFGSNNVLVGGGEVTGLLDWSEAMVGDPRYDTANILFWRPWLDCMEQQCRYFEAERPDRLAAREPLACYQLRIGLATLHEALVAAEPRTAAWAFERCQDILAGV